LDNRLSGTVELVSYLGAMIDVHVRVSPADRLVVSQPNRADGQVPKEGDKIEIGWSAQAAGVFPDDGVAANS
jgi:putative spermidine/putrescine transport system ATP-binding protein